MYKAAAVGDRDSIYGFASVGIDIYPVESALDAGKLLRKLAESKVAVIFITEELASNLQNELDAYRDLPFPVVVPIPGVSGNTGMGMASLNRSIERAVGSNILLDA